MNKKFKIVLIIVLSIVFPCLSLLTACSKTAKPTETGFVVFYDSEEITNLSQPLSIVKEADYDFNSHVAVYAKYSDGTKKKLSLKSQKVNGYEVSHNIPELNEIVYGTEYSVKISYGDYEKLEIKLTFCKRLLDTPVLSIDDDAETLSWGVVPNATAYLYKVKLKDATEFGEEVETADNFISLTWGWTVQVRAITSDVEFGASGWATMQSAWMPDRQLVDADAVQVTNVGLTFELDENGIPKIFKPEPVIDDEIIELVFNEGAYDFVKNGASSAGVYTLYFRLKNTNKYCWDDGTTTVKSVNWMIGKRSIEAPTITSVTKNDNGTYTLNGENVESDYFESEVQEVEGGYKVKFTLKYKDSTNWTNVESQLLIDDGEFEITIPLSVTE